MPAANGPEFVSAMDKMLCGLEKSRLASVAEIDAIRGELVRDVRRIGADGLGKMGRVRMGGGQILVPTSSNLKQLGITSQRTEERFSKFRLQWLDKEGLKGAVDRGWNAADQREFHRHSNRMANSARDFLREISELEPSLEDEVNATIAQIDDARNDLMKLELKSWTQLDEKLRRSMGAGMTKSGAERSVQTYDLNRNLFNQSLLAHPPGVVRELLGQSSDRMAARVTTKVSELPKRAFFIPGVCAAGDAAVKMDPGGRTAELAWKVISAEALASRAATLAATRQSVSTHRNLGLGHNSTEWYVPVPPENLDEVRELMRERRETFRALGPDGVLRVS